MKKNYKEVFLKKLGVVLKKLVFKDSIIFPVKYTHIYTEDAQFDFSVSSIDDIGYIVSAIYWQGREDGEKQQLSEIKKSLGL